MCDTHVVKMALETAQLLCSPFEAAPYKRTHYNHPCARWVRESRANYCWLIKHGLALCSEYSFRYGKSHKSEAITKWCQDNMDSLDFPSSSLTPFPFCMDDKYKTGNVVDSYRNYYKYGKRDIAEWKKGRPKPEWF